MCKGLTARRGLWFFDISATFQVFAVLTHVQGCLAPLGKGTHSHLFMFVGFDGTRKGKIP
jgi:hypothetical protein